MHFSCTIRLLLLSSSLVLAAPIPQGAGVGAGCDVILTDGDTGSGLLAKEAGQNAASLLKSAGVKRQGDGVGDGCNAILTDGDTGPGLAVKEAGQNLASLLKSAGAKHQFDKAGAETVALLSLLSPDATAYQEGLTDVIDGDGTSDSAVIGELPSCLESVSSNKASARTAAIISLVSPDAAVDQEGLTIVIGGDGTSDSAVIGQQLVLLKPELAVVLGNWFLPSFPRCLRQIEVRCSPRLEFPDMGKADWYDN